jgi:methionyl-tRNA formyltransferase
MTVNAVVFAYHNVGVRCLSVLLDRGINVPLVVTHEDNPGENIWFDSVADLARLHGIPVATPHDPNLPDMIGRVAALKPNFLFSFYYRHMLSHDLLGAARLGAYNMHGSLLPKYRGRVPVNWAVIRGETETGATLHEMVVKPDAGRIVDQQAVPILCDDTAHDVFGKVTVAAEMVLHRALPKLIDGTAVLITQDLSLGSYFGGRKPEDGRINWNDGAAAVHNLVRGVAPPYPGAFTTIKGSMLRILKTHRVPNQLGPFRSPSLYLENERCYAQCGDRGILQIIEMNTDEKSLSGAALASTLGPLPIALTDNGPSHP